MQLSADDCMAFEDSHNGILSSKGANLKTIITVNDYTRDHDFDSAEIVLDQMGEPGSAFTVLSGDAHGYNYVSVEMVKAIHSA